MVMVVAPTEYPHAAALDEIAETLRCALRPLHCSRRIVLGAHLLGGLGTLDPDAVIYNTEHTHSGWMQQAYRDRLRRHEVWDYSAVNAATLTAMLGKPVRYVPLGYVPELTRIAPAADQDIDVLFYGSLNQRRFDVLTQLQRLGLRVQHVFGVYGAVRDGLIARAKLVLNMHYYMPGRFEIIRVSYLMANRKAVVCERNAGEEVDADLLPGLSAVPCEALAATCHRWVRRDTDRQDLEARALRTFATRDMTAILREALGGSARPLLKSA